jgi:hypothetical protein
MRAQLGASVAMGTDWLRCDAQLRAFGASGSSYRVAAAAVMDDGGLDWIQHYFRVDRGDYRQHSVSAVPFDGAINRAINNNKSIVQYCNYFVPHPQLAPHCISELAH